MCANRTTWLNYRKLSTENHRKSPKITENTENVHPPRFAVALKQVGGALLDPKTVRRERHWFVRYMAIIIGHFTMAMAL